MNFIKTYIVLGSAVFLMFASPVFAGTFSQTPDLEVGSTHSAVVDIQKFLNSNGYIVNPTPGEPGSKGYESDYFGSLTQKALSLFQSSNNINPAQGYFGTKTKTVIDSQSLSLKDTTQTSKSKLSAADTTTCSSGQARSITQFSITWYFDKCYQYGTFANGDYWVVGPVVITKITPESTTVGGWTKNGTMVNPKPTPLSSQTQGFDSSINHNGTIWSASLNVAPSFTGSPLSISTGSVVSTISMPTYGSSGSRPQLSDALVLTVISEPAPAGSFRPAISGADKSIKWNKNNLNYSILKSYASVDNTPSLATVQANFERPWLSFMEHSSSRYISPKNNWQPEYARDQAQTVLDGLLSLHLNYSNAQKETLYVRLVQYGIDIYGSVTNGRIYTDSGALSIGHKAPMVLAGLALNDQGIKDWSDAKKHLVFQEDRQTWFVNKSSDVGRVVLQEYNGDGSCWKCRVPYGTEHIGIPEWGETHTKQPNRDDSRWGDAYYRNIVGGALTGHALFAHLTTDATETWNHPAFFAYYDRYWSIETRNGILGQTLPFPNAISKFTFNMWKAYRGGGTYTPPVSTEPTSPVTVPGDGEDGQETKPPVVSGIPFAKWNLIKVTSNTGAVNVRNNTYIADTTKVGIQSNGATGQIIDGPIEQGGVRWWKINYDNSEIDGWTGQSNTSGTDNLTVTATGVEPPTILVSPKIISPSNNQEFSSDTKKVTVVWENKNTNYLVRYKEINGSEKQINTYTDESIDINVKEGESYVFWIHSGVATPGKWSEPKNEIKFSIKKNTSDQNNSVVPSVPVANNPSIPETVNDSLSAVCTVSNTSFMVGEQITINVTASNLPNIYKIKWSGISTSKVKGFNKKALDQTLFAKKKGIIKPKVEIKNSKNSREKIKVSCPSIRIV